MLDYQKYRYDSEIHICDLEDIRGEMLLNPISRIVFYNYLGLDYRRQASRILDKENKGIKDFSVENMQIIKNNIATGVYSEDQINKIEILLDRAEKCFVSANELAQGNLVWEGSVLLNLTRVHVMRYLLGGEMDIRSILKEFDNVITKRNQEKLLFLQKRMNLF